MRNRPLQHTRELNAHLALLMRWKHGNDAVDRFGGIQRVQGREDEVAGLGCKKRGLDRFMS